MPKIDPKVALDRILKKSRVHFYKPIQIAEILFNHRTKKKIKLKNLESYRNISKRWRDDISLRLVGRRSTSSQKFQDNLFEANAIPPSILADLGDLNKENGLVEAYVYKALQTRLDSVYVVWKYVKKSNADTFSLKHLVSLFTEDVGLKRSIDKIYEIAVYALFAAIVKALKAQVTLEVLNKDREILKDFEGFIQMVLGIDSKNTKLVMPAALYRAGVTNAADVGLDMWANFGPAIQVKHLTLTPGLVEDIVDNLPADKIVIVCLDSEKTAIEALLLQVGWKERIQGIITIDDLDSWYQLCLSKKYRATLGATLLKDVQNEFENEFPSSEGIEPFLQERGYDKAILPEGWEVK
ncbi:MAG: HaeII family restriction endonuclease [Candidatus Yanofskybacteria bacterium]|nr:HaeII family restriction endonuclease [Candidatus Yanofskybacteria bacterium]